MKRAIVSTIGTILSLTFVVGPAFSDDSNTAFKHALDDRLSRALLSAEEKAWSAYQSCVHNPEESGRDRIFPGIPVCEEYRIQYRMTKACYQETILWEKATIREKIEFRGGLDLPKEAIDTGQFVVDTTRNATVHFTYYDYGFELGVTVPLVVGQKVTGQYIRCAEYLVRPRC